MRRVGAKLFAKTSSQDLYAMIDELMVKIDGLMCKHNGTSKLHSDDAVKHAAVHG